jgi:alanyl-tRNA synthetase
LSRAAAALRVPPDEVADRLDALMKEVRQLKKQVAAGPKGGAASVDRLAEEAASVGGVKVVIAEVPGGPNDLRQLIDQLRRKAAPVAVLLANRQEEEQKVTLIAGLSRDLVERGLDAVAWVRAVSGIVGGSGGGRPDMAQAGGKIPAKLPEALEAARGEIEKLLGR